MRMAEMKGQHELQERSEPEELLPEGRKEGWKAKLRCSRSKEARLGVRRSGGAPSKLKAPVAANDNSFNFGPMALRPLQALRPLLSFEGHPRFSSLLLSSRVFCCSSSAHGGTTA